MIQLKNSSETDEILPSSAVEMVATPELTDAKVKRWAEGDADILRNHHAWER
jgi:hypothetical protein